MDLDTEQKESPLLNDDDVPVVTNDNTKWQNLVGFLIGLLTSLLFAASAACVQCMQRAIPGNSPPITGLSKSNTKAIIEDTQDIYGNLHCNHFSLRSKVIECETQAVALPRMMNWLHWRIP